MINNLLKKFSELYKQPSIGNLEEDLREATSKLQAAETANLSLDLALKQAQTELAAIKIAWERIDTATDNAITKVDGKLAEFLESHTELLTSQSLARVIGQSLLTENKKLHIDNKNLRAENQAFKAMIAELDIKNRTLQTANLKLQTTLKQAHDKLAKLQSELEQREVEVDKLDLEALTLDSAIRKLLKENSQLQAENRKLQEENENGPYTALEASLELENSALQKENQRLQQLLEQYKGDVTIKPAPSV